MIPRDAQPRLRIRYADPVTTRRPVSCGTTIVIPPSVSVFQPPDCVTRQRRHRYAHREPWSTSPRRTLICQRRLSGSGQRRDNYSVGVFIPKLINGNGYPQGGPGGYGSHWLASRTSGSIWLSKEASTQALRRPATRAAVLEQLWPERRNVQPAFRGLQRPHV